MLIPECRPFKEIDLDMVLKSTDRANHSIVRKDGGAPLPFFSDVRIRIVDESAEFCQRFAAPPGSVCNLLVDLFRRFHSVRALRFVMSRRFEFTHGRKRLVARIEYAISIVRDIVTIQTSC